MADDDLQGLEDLEEIEPAEDEPAEMPIEEEVPGELAEPEVTDPRWGQLVDTIDTTGDGYSDIELRDADGDGRVDFVVGDINDDGIEDTALQDTDGDSMLDSGTGRENWEHLSGIDDMDVDWIDRDAEELDSDRDGVTNIDEHEMGLDTLDQDSDDDNFEDGWELEQGSDPADWADDTPAETQAWAAEQEMEYEADMAASEASYDTYDASYDAGAMDTSYDAGLDTSYDAGSLE